MGIDNRDYVRYDHSYNDGFSAYPICKYLIIINVVVFLLQIFIVKTPSADDVLREYEEVVGEQHELTEGEIEHILRNVPKVSLVQEWLQLDSEKVFKGQFWRLLTYGFCHDRMSIFHLLFNMLFLWWFGRTLEKMYGAHEFLTFYLVSILVAAVAYIALDLYTGDLIPSLGASGGVMAVVMLFTMHFPYEKIRIWFIFPIEMRWIVLIYLIFDLHPVLLALAGDKVNSGVAHAAHLGGLAFGFFYKRQQMRLYPYWRKLIGAFSSKGPRPTKTKKDLSTASNTFFNRNANEKVDDILQKISDHGFDSLTPKEKKILEEASKRYRDRG